MPSPRPRRTLAARERAERLSTLPFQVFGRKDPRPFGAMRDLWARRELLVQLVRRELKVRYKDSSLGFLWTLIRPITMLLIYYVAIGRFLGAERHIPDFAVFVFTGLTIWGLYSDTITQATSSILTNAALIKKVFLPRELFPLASAGAVFVNFVIQMVVLVTAALALGGLPPVSNLVYALAGFLIAFVFAVALGLLMSALNVYLRDVQYLVEVGLLILFWASPIVYSWQLVSEQLQGSLAWAQEVYLANPMTIAVISFQQAFWAGGAEQAVPDALDLRILVMFAIGLVVLWMSQRIFARLQGDFAQEV